MKTVQQQFTHHIPHHPGSRLPKRTLAIIKQSFNSRYQRYIEALHNSDSDDEISSREPCQSMIQSIHTNEVKDYLDLSKDNKVLKSPAPETSEDEQKLPRKTCRIVAQLRYTPHLRAYLERTGVEDSDLCPDCKKQKHITNHLFDCEANPTNLCVLSLWESPPEAADFLHFVFCVRHWNKTLTKSRNLKWKIHNMPCFGRTLLQRVNFLNKKFTTCPTLK